METVKDVCYIDARCLLECDGSSRIGILKICQVVHLVIDNALEGIGRIVLEDTFTR